MPAFQMKIVDPGASAGSLRGAMGGVPPLLVRSVKKRSLRARATALAPYCEQLE
jgi:hypothetical protein